MSYTWFTTKAWSGKSEPLLLTLIKMTWHRANGVAGADWSRWPCLKKYDHLKTSL